MAKIRHQVGIVGNINKIYKAMHEPEGLKEWWATTAEGTPETGQTIHLNFSHLVTLSFRIESLKENELVSLTCVTGPNSWQGSTLKFSLRQGKDQVWAGLEHENKSATEDDFLYFHTKWTCYLLSLRDLIETGKGHPYPNDIKIHLGD